MILFCIIQNGITPLYRAAEEGYTEIVKMLLETGADIDATDKVKQLISRFNLTFLSFSPVSVSFSIALFSFFTSSHLFSTSLL